MNITPKTTAKELKLYLKENGFDLNVRLCTGTLKQYFIVGAKKVNGEYRPIVTEKLNKFFNENFTGFDNSKFDMMSSYNGGQSTFIRRY